MMFNYSLTFVLAFCALLYELLIARVVSLWAVNNAVWYALAVGIFIGGMGLGAWFTERGDKTLPAWKRLFGVECRLALAGGLSVLAVYAAALLGLFLDLSGAEFWGRVLFFGVAFTVALGVGIGAGMELPLLMTMADDAPGAPGDNGSRILLMDYAGALAAGMVFPLMVIPFMSVMTAAVLAAFMNAIAALWLLWHERATFGHKRVWFLLLFMAVLYVESPRIEGYFTSKYYFSFQDHAPLDFFRPHVYPGRVERVRSPYQVIDLVTAEDIGPEARGLLAAYIKPYPSDNKALQGSVLFLNNDFQFAVSFERIYHEAFAHIPVAVSGQVPEKVLILGAGDGLLLREVLKYPGVKDVVLVDIDPKVLGIFTYVKELAALNDNALRDPRVRVITGDAYQFVRRSREMYDMVFCDFPNPDDYDLAKLYSREFYTWVFARLRGDGLLVLDAPGLGRNKGGERTVWGVLSNSLNAAGFKSIRAYFSRLEDDNPAALALLDNDQEALRGYLEGLTAGFVMASRDDGVVWSSPRALNVGGLRVMTNERVRLALAEGSRFIFEPDPNAVNSILRPLLPLRGDAGKIRSGY